VGKPTDYRLKSVIIHSLTANKLSTQQSHHRLVDDSKVEFMNITEASFDLKVTKKIGFEPSGLFEMSIEAVGSFSSKNKLTPDDIKLIEMDAAEPVLQVISLVVAFLSEKFINGPALILPPILGLNQDDQEDELDDCRQ
jgi:hypothetical protein